MIKPVKNDAYEIKHRKVDAELGDRKRKGFKPSLKLKRWMGECEIDVGFEVEEGELEEERDAEGNITKIKWKVKTADYELELEYHPLDPRKEILVVNGEEHEFLQNQEGGLELGITLSKKPSVNVFNLPITTKELKFFYQPPLHSDHPTWADTDGDGAADTFRPENVVGSYAVYHATRSNMHRSKADAEKYRAGKAFHIYRPKAEDAEGKEAWCDLHVDEKIGVLTISVPQEFLDSAVYPVSVDPTFGYETAGGSHISVAIDQIRGSWFTCPEAGVADSITTYSYYVKGQLNSKCGLYKKSDNSFVGETEEKLGSTSAGWTTYNFIAPKPTLQNIDYWIVDFGDADPDNEFQRHFDIQTGKGALRSVTYPNFPDPWSPAAQNLIYSIYCTYTAAPPPKGTIAVHAKLAG